MLYGCGLAGAVAAEEAEYGAGGDEQVDAFEDLGPAIGELQVFNDNGVFGHIGLLLCSHGGFDGPVLFLEQFLGLLGGDVEVDGLDGGFPQYGGDGFFSLRQGNALFVGGDIGAVAPLDSEDVLGAEVVVDLENGVLVDGQGCS